MCTGGKSPSTPKVAAAPLVPPVIAPIEADPESKTAKKTEQQKLLAATGRSSTMLIEGMGDTSVAPTGKRKLLG